MFDFRPVIIPSSLAILHSVQNLSNADKIIGGPCRFSSRTLGRHPLRCLLEPSPPVKHLRSVKTTLPRSHGGEAASSATIGNLEIRSSVIGARREESAEKERAGALGVRAFVFQL